MNTESPKKILIEVMYKADYCLPCLYMDEAVREVVPKYVNYVEYHRVEFMKGQGKKRFLELSSTLFGEEGVQKHLRLAPVPSLFINGELYFDAIPPKFELEAAIEEVLSEKGLGDKGGYGRKNLKKEQKPNCRASKFNALQGTNIGMDNMKIHLEVFHEGEHGIPCVYMARVVESVAPKFEDILAWKKVVTKELAGAQRYEQFSKLLGKPVPIPSIAINNQLVFETIPSTEELKACIDQIINNLFL